MVSLGWSGLASWHMEQLSQRYYILWWIDGQYNVSLASLMHPSAPRVESTCWRRLAELSTKWIGFAPWLSLWEVQIRRTAEVKICPDNWSFQVVFSLQSYCEVSVSEWWLQLWLGLVKYPQKLRYVYSNSTSVVWRRTRPCSVWSFAPCISSNAIRFLSWSAKASSWDSNSNSAILHWKWRLIRQSTKFFITKVVTAVNNHNKL